MKIIITGWGEVGKDTVCDSIRRQFHKPFISSSLAAKDMVFEMSPYLQSKYQDSYAAWQDRRTPENRAEWFKRICQINADDPAKLAKIIFETSDLYSGMRNDIELFKCQEDGICDLSVWVHSKKHGKFEDRNSMTIEPHMCDIEFSNEFDTVKELDEKVYRVFSKFLRDPYPKNPLVYVAGPYTIGDTEQHVYRAIEEWVILRKAGFTPYVPHLTHWVEEKYPQSYDFWMDYCFDVLPKCDYLLRLPGESRGSDMEWERAAELGMPRFTNRDELFAYHQNGPQEYEQSEMVA